MQRVIIDGYNVIHADAALRTLAQREIESARHGLVDLLRGYLVGRRVRMTVVFDGRGMLTDAEIVVPGRLQAVYSAAGQSADEVIVATLQRDANPRRYIVVTSDMADIGREARSMGATVLSSEDFLERLRRDPSTGRPSDSEKPDPDEVDVDYWLERFGDGDGESDDEVDF